MIKILQSLNQNAVLVLEKNAECIVLGKGVGFSKKKGDLVDKQKIDKIYEISKDTNRNNFSELLEDISEENIQIASEITKMAEKDLDKTFSGNFVITLANHIEFLIEKYENVKEMKQLFHYELKYFYPNEFKVANKAYDYLQTVHGYKMPEAEISFLTLHIVNGLLDNGELKDAVQLSEILDEMISLIEKEVKCTIKRDSIEFSRFIVHLRYFVIRNWNQNKKRKIDSEFYQLFELSKTTYSREYKLVCSIKRLLGSSYDFDFGLYDEFYLLLHIVRLTKIKEGRDKE